MADTLEVAVSEPDFELRRQQYRSNDARGPSPLGSQRHRTRISAAPVVAQLALDVELLLPGKPFRIDYLGAQLSGAIRFKEESKTRIG